MTRRKEFAALALIVLLLTWAIYEYVRAERARANGFRADCAYELSEAAWKRETPDYRTRPELLPRDSDQVQGPSDP